MEASPSLWWNRRHIQNNPRCPDFKNNTTGLCNPSCVRSRGLTKHGLLCQIKDGESCVHRDMEAKQIYHKGERGEEGKFQDSPVSLVASLQACAKQKDLHKGRRLHADIRESGLLSKNIYVGTVLVNMYAKCGALVEAQGVFDELPTRDVVSWSALIAGYAQHGHAHEAMSCFERMQHEGLSPNAVTFSCILKACGSIGAAEKGEEIHAEVVKQRLLEKNTILGNAVVDMYAKCGALVKAQEVFDKLPVRDVVSWNALITGYAQHGHGHEALNCFRQMQCEGLIPNAVTFACVAKACGSIGAADKGEEIHVEIVKRRLLGKNTILGTALVDMYSKCGALGKAQEVFNKLSVRDVVAWSALIAGYAEQGHGHEALNSFEQMQREGVSPNVVTFACSLKACGSIGAAEKGEEIHAKVVRQRLLEKHHILGNALVDMYAKCGKFQKAQAVFDKLPVRDVVSWNALIGGYAQHGHAQEALNCFEKMQGEDVSPDAVTFACILKACSSIGAAEKGEEIHAEVVRQRLLENHTILGSVLVDMYAKCGTLEKAQKVFHELPVRSVVSWSALMAGCAQLGKVEVVFNLFNRMRGEGIEPDQVIFTVLLNACSHAGLLDEGEMFFVNMIASYRVTPTLEHCACIVDLFGRAGHLQKALVVIDNLPLANSVEYRPLWAALLGACRQWGNVTVASLAFKQLVRLDGKDAAAFVCMSNIYACNLQALQRKQTSLKL